MPVLVPNASVVVIRNRKRVKPLIGKPFKFTDEEVATIRRILPTALRVPVNEVTSATDDEDENEVETETDNDDTDEAEAEVQRPAKKTKKVKKPVEDDDL